MTLLFLAGIYFFARGVFALYGQTIFYTKRVLENIEEKDIPAYLKEIGKMNLLLGVLFVGKACLDIPFPWQSPHSVWMAADFAALRIFHFQNRYKI